MNIKDPLNPYTDTRKKDARDKIEALSKRKAVHKCNFELIMGYAPPKASMFFVGSKGFKPRTGDATMNGRPIR